MVGGEDRDPLLDVQRLVRQPVQIVERHVEQRHIRPPVAQMVDPVGAAAEQDVHPARVGPASVFGEDPGQQVGVAPRLDHQPQMSLVARGPPRAAHRGADRVHRVPAVLEQRRAGRCERDMTARPYEQLYPEPRLDPPDRLRQRRLRDRQPYGGAAEVQLLGDRDEVLKLSGLQFDHAHRLSPVPLVPSPAPSPLSCRPAVLLCPDRPGSRRVRRVGRRLAGHAFPPSATGWRPRVRAPARAAARVVRTARSAVPSTTGSALISKWK